MTVSEDAMAPQSFDDAVETARRNLGSMAQGNAAPTIALLSQGDDVVLANPLGPPIVGFASVAAEVERVASMFVDGEPTVFDEVARWVSNDLGYVVAIEHAHVKRSGSEGFVPMDLRVTTIFRRESDGWRVCVRHADRVTAMPTPTG
jgi:ketosteroid isomerase-like protein